MFSQILDNLGDGNPQLFREIKGKLKPRNLIISGTISAILQGFLWILTKPESLSHWQTLFIIMSEGSVLTLIIVGIYMLVNDLYVEEKRGTLNFLRLSPTEAKTILLGKIIGVPLLLYLVILLAVPLHLIAGILGEFNLGLIICFYALTIASCAFFYSMALVIALIGYQIQALTSWALAAVSLMFLSTIMSIPIRNTPFDWLSLLSPTWILHYINGSSSNYLNLEQLQFFHFSFGLSAGVMIILALVNYGFLTYFNFAALSRQFYNRYATLSSKKNSYIQAAFSGIMLVGFAMQTTKDYGNNASFPINFYIILGLNLLFSVVILATLLPQHQALEEWATYPHRDKKSVINDLIWGEKSPAIVAIAINQLILGGITSIWILTWGDFNKIILELGCVLIQISMMLILSIMTEIFVVTFKPNPRLKQYQNQISGGLTFVGICLMMSLPVGILFVLKIVPPPDSFLWMLSPIPWIAVHLISPVQILLGFLSHVTILGLLGMKLKSNIKKFGANSSFLPKNI